MMPIDARLATVLLLLCLAATPIAAQEPAAPSPSPTATPAMRKDPLGIAGLGGDRPANSRTEITAQKEATFDEKGNKAVFTGDVRVNDPQFTLTADKLIVTLAADRSGIARAEAEGNVVIVQETKSDQPGAIGRARSAVYEPESGNVTLSGWPEIQQGINRHIATEAGTRMILNRDGRARTYGGSRTVITDTPDRP